MPSLTVMYTHPTQGGSADDFIAEYRADHVPIAERFPGMASFATTVFTGTPRGGEPPYLLMFQGHWDTQEAMDGAMRDPSLMEASKHAMHLTATYGNRAEMLIGA
jgi:uncharacterized protein (TIGR02118 family)